MNLRCFYDFFNKDYEQLALLLRCIYRMVRKISHITLAFLLLFATTGITVHQHYCMGNVVKTSVLHEPSPCCGEGNDCCSNESETFQLNEDYTAFLNIIEFQDIYFDIPEIKLLFSARLTVSQSQGETKKVLRPPDISTVLALLQVYSL